MESLANFSFSVEGLLHGGYAMYPWFWIDNPRSDKGVLVYVDGLYTFQDQVLHLDDLIISVECQFLMVNLGCVGGVEHHEEYRGHNRSNGRRWGGIGLAFALGAWDESFGQGRGGGEFLEFTIGTTFHVCVAGGVPVTE